MIGQLANWAVDETRLKSLRTIARAAARIQQNGGDKIRIFLEHAHYEHAHYAASTMNLRVAAVRRFAYEASDAGLLSPDLAAGIRDIAESVIAADQIGAHGRS